jgi:hypothetical protein
MLYLGKTRDRRKKEQGQSLIEFSISMIFFLFFAMGLLDLGRVYFVFIALEDSAGEAAVFLSINPNCNYPPGYTGDTDGGADVAPTTGCANPNNALYRARKAASGYFQWENSGATVDVDYIHNTHAVGSTVRVQITYPFPLLTPVISNIVSGGKLTLTATATQTLMME